MNPPPTEQTSVLIVGAGPAGLAAAAELAHHGIDCIVIEPRLEVAHDRPRAKTTSVRTMEHLRRWGVAEALRAAAPLSPAWSQRVTFCESLTGERVVDIDAVFGLTIGRDARFSEPGQQVPQPIIEDVLRDHLRQLPEVDFRTGWRAVAATVTDHDASVHLEDTVGNQRVILARYLLACDGANSIVRQSAGIRLEGKSDGRANFNVVFHAPELDTHLGPAVQYWVVGAPTPGLMGRLDLNGKWWAILPGVGPDDGRSRTKELLHELIGEETRLDVLATDSWTARMLVATTFQAGPIYLVGESAHLNPPWGGHGFNTCVGDAVNIAWKIAAVEQGWADDRLLLSYTPERRKVVEQTVQTAAHNMESLPRDIAHNPDAIVVTKKTEFHSLGLVLGYSYADSPVIQNDVIHEDIWDITDYVPNTNPGSRLPHHWLPDGSSLFDHLGKGMTLVGPLNTQPHGVDTLRDDASRLGIPLTIVPSPATYPWADDFLLVRPDQHIAWRTRDPASIDLMHVVGKSVPRPTNP